MKKGILLILLVTLFAACSSDDNNEVFEELNGEWKMTLYVAFLPELPVINDGDITWTFNVSSSELTIVNAIETEYPYILPSGTYDIVLTSNTVKILTITYDYLIDEGILIVKDHPEVDGPIMNFISE